MIVWPKAAARGKVQECAPSHMELWKPKFHHFLIKTLTLKTNDCLIECYVHEHKEMIVLIGQYSAIGLDKLC